MFICSECGTKYEIMPKFCDCGNDIFIEETSEKQTEKFTENENTITSFNNHKENNTHTTRKTGRGKPKTFSPFAIGGFVFCLIMALIVLLFIGNPEKKETDKNTELTEQKEEIVNIPDIDTFWDNTIAKIEITQIPEPKTQKIEEVLIDKIPKFVQNIIPQEEPAKQNKNTAANVSPTQNSKTTLTNSKQVSLGNSKKISKTQTPPQIKTNTQTKKNKSTNQVDTQALDITNRVKNKIQYNTQTSSTTNNSNSANNNFNISTKNSVPIQKNNTAVPQNQNTPAKTPVTKSATTQQPQQITPPQQVVKTKSQAELKKELSIYKSSLRNTIGKKIDFTKVIGDGDCTLSFKINSSGKLISRTFTKQSSNITLNDAVYSAMNSTTSYNPPPEGYKGETLYLKIRFYNGNFEISLN